MYSFHNIETVCFSLSNSNCCFLACIQISQEAGQVVWFSHLFKNFLQIVIHTVKGFGIVNKAEIDVLLELSCFFNDPTNVDILISGSSAFSKSCLNICGSLFTYCWSLAWRILSIMLLAWDEYSCAVVWAFFGIAFLWDWKWKLTFSSPVANAEFYKFAGVLSVAPSSHYLLGTEIAQVEFHHLHLLCS